MLGYTHLRLQQIFDTSETKDGWFGEKFFFFGDLFQLPPIDAPFAFVDIDTETVSTRFRSISISMNLWSFFEYDELTINMRQKNDPAYYELLSRIRLGLVTKSNIDTLQTRLIQLPHLSTNRALHELFNYLINLPSDTVCIFSLRKMCQVLNEAIFDEIVSDLIIIDAIDGCNLKRKSECFKKNISKILEDGETKE